MISWVDNMLLCKSLPLHHRHVSAIFWVEMHVSYAKDRYLQSLHYIKTHYNFGFLHSTFIYGQQWTPCFHMQLTFWQYPRYICMLSNKKIISGMVNLSCCNFWKVLHRENCLYAITASWYQNLHRLKKKLKQLIDSTFMLRKLFLY